MVAARMRATPQLAHVVQERLGVLRTGENLTQRELAEECHVPLAVLNRAIKGVSTPSPDALVKIADHYGVSVDWLLGRIDGRPKRIKPRIAG